jgi:RNA polymerase sigma factor (sigma-70 family)
MDATTLIQHCQAGDYAAIESFVITYRSSVFKLALSILNDPDEADEASQEAFIAALKGVKTFRGEADVKTWLFTITLNECRRRHRKHQGWERLKDQVLSLFHLEKDFAVQPEDAVIQNQRDTVLWNAVQALGEKHRLPVILWILLLTFDAQVI